MRLNRWTIALYMALVFASGTVLGFFVNRFYTVSAVSANAPRNPDEFRKQYLNEMKSRVKISDDQAKQLNLILDETRAMFRSTRDSIEPQLQQIRDYQQERIGAVLNPQQRLEYQKLREERAERLKQQGRPPSR